MAVMIPTRVYVVASSGHFPHGTPPPVDALVSALCQRMLASSPNWGLRSDVRELDELHLYGIAQLKYSLAGGLPSAYRVRWDMFSSDPNFSYAHSVHPDYPWQWLRPTRAGLRFEVEFTGGPNWFLILFDQGWEQPPTSGWEEAPIHP